MSDYSALSSDELAARLADLDARIQSELRADRIDRAMVASLRTTADAIRAEMDVRAERGTPSGWQGVIDDSTAAWALARIAEKVTEIDRLRRNAQAYIDQIQADALRDEKPLTDAVAYFEGELRRYYETLPGQPNTYKLPTGRIERRKGRPSTKVVDVDAYLEWAESAAPEAIKRSPLTSPLKGWDVTDDGQVVSPHGEIVPGVEVVVGEPTVSIKPTRRPES